MKFSRSLVTLPASLCLLSAGVAFAATGQPTISIVSGDGQVVASGFIATAPLTVLVRDSAGNPVPNAAVKWTVTKGLGNIVNIPPQGSKCNADITDSTGQTCHSFVAGGVVLPITFAQSTVTATYSGASATFTETTASQNNGALEVQTLFSSPQANQLPLVGPAGTQGAVPITVKVYGVFGLQTNQGVSHVSVSIQSTDSNSGSTISCAGGTIYTDAAGVAVCNPVFGGKAGPVLNFAVTIGGTPTQTYRFQVTTGPPAVFKILSGDKQSGRPGQTLNGPLTAEIDDAGGNPLSGIAAVFEPVQTGGVTLSDIRSPSDASGRVSARATLGNVAGAIQVRVRTTSGSPSALFTLTVNITVTGMNIVSGDAQDTVIINTPFPDPLVVKVVDNNGNGVQSVAVQFGLANGSAPATFGSPSVVTDAQGEASTTVTAGATPGDIVITATATGVQSLTFHLSSRLQGPQCTDGSTFFNGAGFQKNYISPGGIVTITCSHLAPGLQGSVFAPYGQPLPYQLSNVTVFFGDKQAPIYNVSNLTSTGGIESVTVQVPFEVTPGSVQVTINVGPGNATVTAPVSAAAPGLFEWVMPDNKKRAVMLRPDGSVVSTTNPAQRGETIRAFVTGLIAPPALLTGMYSPPGSDITSASPILVGVNNAGVPAIRVAYAENLQGVWEVDFQVPASAATGNDAPFAIGAILPDSTVAFSQSSKMPIQ